MCDIGGGKGAQPRSRGGGRCLRRHAVPAPSTAVVRARGACHRAKDAPAHRPPCRFGPRAAQRLRDEGPFPSLAPPGRDGWRSRSRCAGAVLADVRLSSRLAALSSRPAGERAFEADMAPPRGGPRRRRDRSTACLSSPHALSRAMRRAPEPARGRPHQPLCPCRETLSAADRQALDDRIARSTASLPSSRPGSTASAAERRVAAWRAR